MPIEPQTRRKLYKVVIPDDPEAEAIVGMGIVTRPAIERGFQAFSASDNHPDHFSLNIPLENFKAQTESNQILIGAAMIPDQLIPRIDENGEAFDLVFTKDAVKWLAQNFERRAAKNPELRRALNFEHSDMKVQGEITNSYIQTENDFSVALGLDATPGAWIIACFIEDKGFFQNFIDRKIATGFSIEIVMDKTLVFGDQFTATEPTANFSFDKFSGFIKDVEAFGQTPFGTLIQRTPTPQAANVALMNKKNAPSAFALINEKIAKRQTLSWSEFGATCAYFAQAENLSTPEALALGGVESKEWISSTIGTLNSKLKQGEKFGLIEDLVGFANEARFAKLMRKLKANKAALMKNYEAKSAFEKLKSEDGLKYFLDNENELMKLFKKKAII